MNLKKLNRNYLAFESFMGPIYGAIGLLLIIGVLFGGYLV